MQTVKIDRIQLLEIVKENLLKHVAEYKIAVVGYREAYIKRLSDALANVDTVGVDRNLLAHLPEPENHQKEYERVIRMLAMSADNFIELEEYDFNQYVLDEWAWAARAKLSNSFYAASNR